MNKKKLCLFAIISLVIGTIVGFILYLIFNDIEDDVLNYDEDDFDVDTGDDLEFLDKEIYDDFM